MICILVALVALSTTGAITIKELHDGLAITHEGSVHLEGGQWRFLMSIEEPVYPDLKGHVAAVRDFITGLSGSQRTALGPLSYSRWLMRLANIHTDTSTPQRQRLSLLPFLGRIASELIGTVSEDEVAALRSAIDNTRAKQEEIVHFVDNMITVVNTTHQIAMDNRRLLKNLNSYLTDYLAAVTSNVTQQLRTLELHLTINEVIHEVELESEWCRHQQLRYLRLRESLEAGRITEELLPPSLISRIRPRHHVPRGVVL